MADVPIPLVAVQHQLVRQFGRVSAHHEELADRELEREIPGLASLETDVAPKPTLVQGHMTPEHCEALRHRIVAQPPGGERKVGIHRSEVQCVAVLVPEGLVVGVPASRPQNQVDFVRHAYRRTEGPGLLARPLFDVEPDAAALQRVQSHFP